MDAMEWIKQEEMNLLDRERASGASIIDLVFYLKNRRAHFSSNKEISDFISNLTHAVVLTSKTIRVAKNG